MKLPADPGADGALASFPPPDPLSGRLTVGFKTTPNGVTWPLMESLWVTAGELDVFTAGWMADHLTDARQEHGGNSWESITLMAALAHHVPGKWLGHAVLANTFRLPAVVAKQAIALDHVTGGRYIVGLGAGWHEGEHEAYGIPLPPIGERIDRLESAVGVLVALFSAAARTPPGVSSDDRFYPLREAVSDPAPVTEAGPPIWLGGQKRRGIALAARTASGWLMPGVNAGDDRYLAEKRDAMLQALESIGRPGDGFTFAAQVMCGSSAAERRVALASARACVTAGAQHVILGMTPSLGPEVLRAMAREVAEPLLERA